MCYNIVIHSKRTSAFRFEVRYFNHNISVMILHKPLVEWHHGSLQNCNHQFDSDRACHRHTNDMCGSSEREVGQVSEAFAVL